MKSNLLFRSVRPGVASTSFSPNFNQCLAGCGALLLLFSFLPWASAQSAASEPVLSITCEFEAPRLQASGGYTRVNVDGCEQLHRTGAPLLPFRTVRLLLPPENRVVNVTARAPVPAAPVPGNWLVDYGRLPMRIPDPNAPAVPSVEPDEPDPLIYSSNEPYPPARAELASVQVMAGYTIAFVRVYPVQYIPANGELSYAAQLSVQVEVAPEAGPVKPAGASVKAAALPWPARQQAKDRVADLVDNPALLDAYETKVDLMREWKSISVDYLIITRSSLASAFQPLADLKTQRGMAVKVETVEAIGNAYAGRDEPEKIRNYIKYAYTNWGISYVLLGGDIATVPCRYAYVGMGSLVSNPVLPSDLYYSCLDGSWNSDNDARWGEPNDGENGGPVDLLGDVAVGRAPVDTVTEVNTFVEKVTRYETQAHAHLTNVLFIAEFLAATPSGPAQGGDMFDPLLSLFSPYQVSWLDDRPFTAPQWTKTHALNALNQSPHLVLLNGHGNDETLIGVNYPFLRSIETPNLDALTNSWPFLAYSVGCNVGQFDNDRFSPDSIGEELVKRHSRGAFAAVLNSRLGWYDQQDEAKYSGEFQHRFFEHLLGYGHTNLGMANQLSKHDLLGHLETTGIMTYRWCYYEITYFGDPHTAWQTPPPASIAPQLVVASAHESAVPSVGTYVWDPDSLITCRITNSPLAAGDGRQYVCTGWSGTGSVPASGIGTQVTFAITNDSLITWHWKTQVWLAVAAADNGSVTANGGWHDIGASGVTVIAEPSRYYHFAQWTGDVPAGSASNPTLQLTMDRPRNLTAVFAENLTSRGTPEWWLAGHGWTSQFETAANADTDQDGLAAWQEYVAGTSPVNAASRLQITPQWDEGSGFRLTWPSAAGRRYSIYRMDTLAGGNFVSLTNGLHATPPFNTFIDTRANLPAGFYQIEVNLNP